MSILANFFSFIYTSWRFTDVINLFLVLIILYIYNFYYKYFTRPNPLPGPFPLPLVGNLHQKDGDLSVWVTKLNKKYGDIFELYFGKSRNIVLSRGDYVEKMNKSSNFIIRMPHNEGLEEYGINAIGIAFTSDMKSWKYNRTFFNRAIVLPSFGDKALDLTHEIYNRLENSWIKLSQLNNEKNFIKIDLPKWMHAFTSDLIIEATTGNKSSSIHALCATACGEELPEYMKHSDQLLKHIMKFIHFIPHFYSLPYWVRHYIPLKRSKTKEGLKIRDELFKIIHEIINVRRKEIDNTPDDVELQSDLLTLQITANTPRDKLKKDKEYTEPIPDNVIIGNILDAFLGGTDTIANLFCYIVYYISKHPDVLAKLRQEIKSIFGDGPVNRPLTQPELNGLKYTEAIIKETGRIQPIAIISPRISSKIDEIAGYTWPANTSFFQFYEGIFRNSYHWQDTEIFDPERFYSRNDDSKNNLFLFGGGIRICPGKRLALTELKSLMCFIFSKYDVELVDPKSPLKITAGFSSNCDELEIRIKPKA